MVKLLLFILLLFVSNHSALKCPISSKNCKPTNVLVHKPYLVRFCAGKGESYGNCWKVDSPEQFEKTVYSDVIRIEKHMIHNLLIKMKSSKLFTKDNLSKLGLNVVLS